MHLIILDRDGVINHDSEDYIKSPDEWLPIAGSIEAIARLSQADYRIVVATNQAGLGRRLFDLDALMHMHDKMHRLVNEAGGEIEAVVFCPHRPEDGCDCRKPKPGMLLEIAGRFMMDLQDVPFVGDSLRDLQAARAAGAKPVLVRTGNGARTLATLSGFAGVEVYDNLAAFADAVLAKPA